MLIFNLGWDMVGYQNPELGYVLWVAAAILLVIPAAYWLVSVVKERDQATTQLEQMTKEYRELRAAEQQTEERLRSTEQERDNLRTDKEHLEVRAEQLQEDRGILEEAARRSLLPDPARTYFKDEGLHIFDLARNRTIIKDRTFEECDIYGPAIIALLGGSDFIDCTFAEALDYDSLVWDPSDKDRHYVGAIGLERCVFRGCNFYRVGLLTRLEEDEDEEPTNQ